MTYTLLAVAAAFALGIFAKDALDRAMLALVLKRAHVHAVDSLRFTDQGLAVGDLELAMAPALDGGVPTPLNGKQVTRLLAAQLLDVSKRGRCDGMKIKEAGWRRS